MLRRDTGCPRRNVVWIIFNKEDLNWGPEISCGSPLTRIKHTPLGKIIQLNKIQGSFSASSCQHSGQWNVLQSYVDTLSTKQRKNIKVAKFEDLEKTSQIIEELQVKTTTLKETSPDSLSEILMKFSLPVSKISLSFQYTKTLHFFSSKLQILHSRTST